jgi:glycosyltransferase involved in cell wall biosynthesis
MTAAACAAQGLFAIFPVIVDRMLPIAVMREMRKRGLDVVLGRYNATAGVLTDDACADFEAENRLISLTRQRSRQALEELDQIAHERCIGLVVNFGAPFTNAELFQLYAELSQLKERAPHLRILDTLYNSGQHLHAFAAYHTCFDGVLVESDDMVRRLSLPGWPTAHKVESGIDLACFVPAGRALRPVERELCVGYVGRMSIEKNPLGFIELAERLNAALPTTRFAMYGEGPMAVQVQARIAASRLAGIMTFCGYADHPTTALAAIDVLVVPSTLDGRPAVVMEANACGVPVIAAPIGGIPEMIEEGRNGFLVPPRDHARMAALLAGWLADPASFAALRESARWVAEARFDRTRMMNTYEAAFRSVLARPARPRALAA